MEGVNGSAYDQCRGSVVENVHQILLGVLAPREKQRHRAPFAVWPRRLVSNQVLPEPYGSLPGNKSWS